MKIRIKEDIVSQFKKWLGKDKIPTVMDIDYYAKEYKLTPDQKSMLKRVFPSDDIKIKSTWSTPDVRFRTNETEEDFTPIENPKEPKPAAKQFQLLATMITNTKVNDQTNILSAMRALPGVTIVNSQAAIPGSNSEGQLRYKTNVDIKIDTSALEGDIKEAIKKIIADIKEIPGVVEFKVLPKAKETTPY